LRTHIAFITSGDNNIEIGYRVHGTANDGNTIRIGNTDITTTFIRGTSGQTIANGATVSAPQTVLNNP
jgi:hypothetical protein